MLRQIIKRDGSITPFDWTKIVKAISGAVNEVIIKDGKGNIEDIEETRRIAQLVCKLYEDENPGKTPTVEEIQDLVEKTLIKEGHAKTAKAYIVFRHERSRQREMKSSLMLTMENLTFADVKDDDLKRENSNIDGNTAMGTMLRYGSEASKAFNHIFVLDPKHSETHKNGDVHIHDLDFLTLTTTCLQIPLAKLLKGGFSTGHGYLREPNDVMTYAALACIAIQSNQNDQHGGQSIPDFDYAMSDGVRKTYSKLYKENLSKALEFMLNEIENSEEADKIAQEIMSALENSEFGSPTLSGYSPEALKPVYWIIKDIIHANDVSAVSVFTSTMKEQRIVVNEKKRFGVDERLYTPAKLHDFAEKHAQAKTRKTTFQAMEALVHNLNTMNSRAGAQVPFSSINYGTDTSPEGRLVIEQILLALEAGLGRHEIPLFPIHIFKTKEGVNYNPEDPNYDLFKLAMKVSAHRMYPNFSFLDAPFNLPYYRENKPETEVAYMGCRTRVIGNVYDPEQQIVHGRGNLSFTTINLPRLAIKAVKLKSETDKIDAFFSMLDKIMNLTIDQLMKRYELVANKKVKNFPFLMGQGNWLGSDKLGPEASIGEILKHGTLSVGFIGLAEVLTHLTGFHHGESADSQALGLRIIETMRKKCDDESAKRGMNITLLATPAEGLCHRFTNLDRAKYGVIKGVTDKEYYTNSNHIPVGFEISIYDKINLEAPYHALTNAGHIMIVETDGNISENPQAFEKIVRHMKEAGIGYGGINHPIDTDTVCGYTGVITDHICPKCGRNETEDCIDENGNNKGVIAFAKIRRVTGYLADAVSRFNDGKRAELRDRKQHSS